ncbi:hypothetical protein [Blastomonas fulva]|uniref:hypothetical protein n=1 Tax=Blastomonas fulva TaxID=1550728 RepID=UPI003F708615
MRVLWLAVLISAPAVASTPDSWASMEAEMAKACLAAADLKDGRISEPPVHFSDASRASVARVTGRWKPAHMKNRRADLLCLYTRGSSTAEIQERRRAATR